MRCFAGLRVVLGLALAFPVLGGEPKWAPIPAEVWSLKDSDSQGTGAVVVERSITFNNHAFEYFYRIRILSEAGRGATAVIQLADGVEEVQGRTVTRDGQTFPFKESKDLLKKTVASGHSWSLNKTLVVPPGLSSDCVVDFQWMERQAPVYRDESNRWSEDSLAFPLALAYPIQLERLSIPYVFSYNWSLRGLKNNVEVAEGSSKIITLKNVPAIQTVPFALEPARDIPRLILYRIPAVLMLPATKTAEVFWAAAAKDYYRLIFAGVKVGRRYRSWADQVLKGLPESPQAAALELGLRLDSEIQNLANLTFQEAAVTKTDAFERADAWDLDRTVARGFTNKSGMLFLYLNLLKEARLPYRIVAVADRTRALVDPGLKVVSQFTDLLVAVPETGKPDLWMTPGLRFATPGQLHPDFQGTRGFAMDPLTWKAEFVVLPVQAGWTNQRTYTYRLEVGEEEDRFQVAAAFAGFPEYRERMRFMALEPQAQSKLLREDLEGAASNLRLARAEVLNTGNPRMKVSWQAAGSRERESGRRLAVQPFPGLPAPIPWPASWTKRREDLICMPYLGIFQAVATFKIPEGYRLLEPPALDRKNFFGSVQWSQTRLDGGEAKVVLKVEVEQPGGGADHYRDLKDLAAWVREAMGQTTMLEKE